MLGTGIVAVNLIVLVVAAIALSIGPAILAWWLAHERGRSPGGWFLAGLLLGPVAILALGFAPTTDRAYILRCPECKGEVIAGAKRCAWCGVTFPERARFT